MRIYRRAAFLDLPPGTIYAKGKPWAWEGLHRKGDTILDVAGRPIDFLMQDLVNIEMGHDTGEWVERQELMLAEDASFPLNDDLGRDGCFDDEDIFLVYEREDLDRLYSIIGQATAIAR